MTRTTIDIDHPILMEIKRLQKSRGQTMGSLVSQLLAEALDARRSRVGDGPTITWQSRPMRARVDVADKDAVWRVLEEDERAGLRGVGDSGVGDPGVGDPGVGDSGRGGPADRSGGR